MRWQRVSRDIPEGVPILVSCAGQAVVALAFRGDYYFPEATFMDARTCDILPVPSHWMPLPDKPQAQEPARREVSARRRAA